MHKPYLLFFILIIASCQNISANDPLTATPDFEQFNTRYDWQQYFEHLSKKDQSTSNPEEQRKIMIHYLWALMMCEQSPSQDTQAYCKEVEKRRISPK